MSVLISEIDVRLNKLNFLDQNNPKIFTNKPLAQFAVSFKCWFIMRKLWVVTYKSLTHSLLEILPKNAFWS